MAAEVEWILEHAVEMLADVALFQRVLAAIWRTERKRWRKLSPEDRPGLFTHQDRDDSLEPHDFELRHLATVIDGIAIGDDLSPRRTRTIEAMIQHRLARLPSGGDLRGRHDLRQLRDQRRRFEEKLRRHASALRKGFGDLGRRRMLVNRVNSATAVLSALHPRWGSKRIDELIARNLGMANESSVRHLRKRSK